MTNLPETDGNENAGSKRWHIAEELLELSGPLTDSSQYWFVHDLISSEWSTTSWGCGTANMYQTLDVSNTKYNDLFLYEEEYYTKWGQHIGLDVSYIKSI